MKLALRRLPASSSWRHRIAAWAIKTRLVSNYCHSGIVIGDTLYHSNTTSGLHASAFNANEWELYDLPGSDTEALALFLRYRGTPYDWFSLLAFLLPGHIADGKRLYCFEWSWLAITGLVPSERITPEMLLTKAVR